MFLNIALKPDNEISEEALVKQVKAALSREPKRPVMVRGDASGPYQNVVASMTSMYGTTLISETERRFFTTAVLTMTGPGAAGYR